MQGRSLAPLEMAPPWEPLRLLPVEARNVAMRPRSGLLSAEHVIAPQRAET